MKINISFFSENQTGSLNYVPIIQNIELKDWSLWESFNTFCKFHLDSSLSEMDFNVRIHFSLSKINNILLLPYF